MRIKERRGCSDKLLADHPIEDSEPPVREKVLSVQSADIGTLISAHDWGADRLVYAPENLTQEALDEAAQRAKDAGIRLSVSLPYVMNSDTMDIVNGWMWKHEELFDGVIVHNVGQLLMEWVGDVQAGEGLNLANRAALKFARDMHCGDYTPSVELNCAQIKELSARGGARELVVYGRLQLMLLRHCPIRARNNGAHDACRRCDGVSEKEHMNAHCIVDRRDTRFPLRRQKTGEGCVIKVMNSVPLLLLKRSGKLPEAKGWRVILTDEDAHTAEHIVRLHRMALDGQDVRETSLWAAVETMPTTTGHYFRGAE
jgi:collagenase-like PrtC family protease